MDSVPDGIKEDVEFISKTTAAVEVLRVRETVRILCIAGIILALLCLAPALFGVSAAMLVVGVGVIVFGYYFSINDKTIKELRQKYKL